MPEHDPAALKDWQRRLGESGMRRVIDALLDDAARMTSVLRASVARGDAGEIQRAAHSLKTPCGMFGAGELARLSQELEDQAAAGITEGAADRAENLVARFEQLTQELAARR